MLLRTIGFVMMLSTSAVVAQSVTTVPPANCPPDAKPDECLEVPLVADATDFVPLIVPALGAVALILFGGAGSTTTTTSTTSTN